MEKTNSAGENWGRIIWLNQLFKRYYSGNASLKEKEIIERWDAEMGEYPNLDSLPKTTDTQQLWNTISYELNFHKSVKKKVFRIGMEFYKYAALFIVLLGIGVYFLNNNPFVTGEKLYYTSTDTIKSIKLPDGSLIKLNNNTRLAIIENEFNKSKREIWLEEGEAFFDVAENPKKPFIVHTQDIMTTVKGTSFNIRAYRELEDNVLSVRSGKVEVSLNQKIVGLFTKNKQLTYHKNSKAFDQGEISWEDGAAWTQGKLVLRRATIKEFKLRLEQHYGVTLDVKDKTLNNTLLNATFEKGADLKTVLDDVSFLYGFKYKVTNNTVVLYNH